MDESPGNALRVDEVVLGAAVRRLTPLADELASALTEFEAILGDLRRECDGHPSGVAFGSAQSALASTTETTLRELRGAVVAFTGDITRADAEFADVDATGASGLGGRR